jgi:uncharacterized protein YacL (UPF0231 family)
MKYNHYNLEVGSIWLNHDTMETHELISWSQNIISGASYSENVEFRDFIAINNLPGLMGDNQFSFRFAWYDDETLSLIGPTDFKCLLIDIDKDYNEHYRFMENISNPNKSEKLKRYLRKNKIKRIIDNE